MHQPPYRHIAPLLLMEAADGDIEVFRDLSRTFLRIAPPMLEQVKKAALAGDLSSALRESHSFKGTAALVGAERLAQMAETIENLSRGGDSSEIVRSLPELAQEFVQVMKEVRDSIDSVQHAATTSLLASHNTSQA